MPTPAPAPAPAPGRGMGGADEVEVMITPDRRRRQKLQPQSPKTPPARAAAASTATAPGRVRDKQGQSPSGSTSTATTTTTTTSRSTWTLYDNPCFCSSHFYPDNPLSNLQRHRRRHYHHHHRKTPTPPEQSHRDAAAASAVPMRERLGTVLERERSVAALERERSMRQEAEALAEALKQELSRERHRREDAERRAAVASEEAARWKAEAGRMEGEVRAAREAAAVQEQRARAEVAEAMLRIEEEKRRLQRPAPEHDDPTAATGGINNCAVQCDHKKEKQQQLPIAPVEHGRGGAVGISPTATPIQQQKLQQQQQRKDAAVTPVENPHIRRGIIGFVEFPRVVGRAARGGPIAKAAAAGAPKLECQKAQLRVLLKGGGGKVAPVAGFPSTAPPHSLVM